MTHPHVGYGYCGVCHHYGADCTGITDAAMIKTPMEWPKWPLLPLKHRKRPFHDDGYTGFLLAIETPPFIVYRANMYFVALSGKPLGEAIKNLPTECYSSADDVAADWRVD